MCVTGDLTETAAREEFDEALGFLQGMLAAKGGQPPPPPFDAVFAVPGNHDVAWSGDAALERWQEWARLQGDCAARGVRIGGPDSSVAVHDLVDEAGLVVAELNSA